MCRENPFSSAGMSRRDQTLFTALVAASAVASAWTSIHAHSPALSAFSCIVFGALWARVPVQARRGLVRCSRRRASVATAVALAGFATALATTVRLAVDGDPLPLFATLPAWGALGVQSRALGRVFARHHRHG